MKQIAGQGYIQTITQPCLQDRMKQITGQGYIQTIRQPCLQDHMKQIANQGYIQTIKQPCLQDRTKQIASKGYCRALNFGKFSPTEQKFYLMQIDVNITWIMKKALNLWLMTM